MTPGSGASAAALWTGLHLVLLLTLSVLVVRQRQKHGVALGDGGVPELARAIRAFGNATEYVPTGLVGLGVLALAGAPALAVHLGGAALFAGRVSHAAGLSRTGETSWPRSIGASITWLAYVFIASTLLVYAVA